MKRIILMIATFILSSTFLINGVLAVSKDGIYEIEAENGSYNSGRLANVIDMRDGIASLSINGERALMKEGEVYTIKNERSDYKGTITLKSIEGNKVTIEVDVQKTSMFLVNIVLAVLFSLAMTLMVGAIPSRPKTNDDHKIAQ